MNRASQLREALKSCLNCVLPDDTTFIIVDNGSTDDTEAVVKDLLSKSKYSFIYKKLEKISGLGLAEISVIIFQILNIRII